MRTLGLIVTMIIVFLALDLTWITWVIKKLYAVQFGSLLHQPYPRLGASALAYLCILIGIFYFGILGGQGQSLRALGAGALFGFCSYGIYAFTNLAVFEPWTFKVAIFEVMGGTINCGLTAGLVSLFFRSSLSS